MSHSVQSVPDLRSKIPGVFALGHLFAAQKDVLSLVIEAQKHFPKICMTRLGFRDVYLVFHPDGVKHVLQSHSKNYSKHTFITDSLKDILGDGLLTNTSESWLKKRRMIQSVFHFEQLRSYVPIIQDEAKKYAQEKRELSKTHATSRVNFSEELMHLALVVVGRCILNKNLSHYAKEIDQDFAFLAKQIYLRSLTPVRLPLNIPLPSHLRLNKIKKLFNNIVFDLVKEARRKKDESSKDLLSLLARAKDDVTGEALTDEEIRDEVVTLFIAGHETTANSLMWTFFLLDKYPDVKRKLKENPSVDSEYLKAVLSEAMRLYPAGWSLVRRSLEDDEVMGYRVPKKSLVILFPYATHHHPEFWTNPHEFNPERWLDKSSERHKFAYFPFGGGPRVCIGNHLARTILENVLAVLVTELDYSVQNTADIVPNPVTTLGMKNDMFVSFNKTHDMNFQERF